MRGLALPLPLLPRPAEDMAEAAPAESGRRVERLPHAEAHAQLQLGPLPSPLCRREAAGARAPAGADGLCEPLLPAPELLPRTLAEESAPGAPCDEAEEVSCCNSCCSLDAILVVSDMSSD